MDHVTLGIDDRLGRLRLARPERHNAITSPMLKRLADLCAEMPDEVDVVLLEAEGRDFSVGFDLDELGGANLTDGATEGSRSGFSGDGLLRCHR